MTSFSQTSSFFTETCTLFLDTLSCLFCFELCLRVLWGILGNLTADDGWFPASCVNYTHRSPLSRSTCCEVGDRVLWKRHMISPSGGNQSMSFIWQSNQSLLIQLDLSASHPAFYLEKSFMFSGATFSDHYLIYLQSKPQWSESMYSNDLVLWAGIKYIL